MAQLLVRNIEESIKAGLRQRAKRHGASMEEEIRTILRNAVKDSSPPPAALGTRISRRFARFGLTGNLPELKEQAVKVPDFGA